MNYPNWTGQPTPCSRNFHSVGRDSVPGPNTTHQHVEDTKMRVDTQKSGCESAAALLISNGQLHLGYPGVTLDMLRPEIDLEH